MEAECQPRCRRWAEAMCGLFARGGLQCRAVGRAEFLPLMVEKLLWSSVFWLLCEALGGLTVGAGLGVLVWG